MAIGEAGDVITLIGEVQAERLAEQLVIISQHDVRHL